jgi:hypothetical protein
MITIILPLCQSRSYFQTIRLLAVTIIHIIVFTKLDYLKLYILFYEGNEDFIIMVEYLNSVLQF